MFSLYVLYHAPSDTYWLKQKRNKWRPRIYASLASAEAFLKTNSNTILPWKPVAFSSFSAAEYMTRDQSIRIYRKLAICPNCKLRMYAACFPHHKENCRPKYPHEMKQLVIRPAL